MKYFRLKPTGSASLVAFLVSLVTHAPSNAVAQDFAGADIVEIEGKLEGAAGNKLKIKTETEELIGLMDNKTRLTYTNTAELSMLRPGTAIRFTADFDTATGIATAPLTELEMFKQVRRPRMGRDEIQSQTPGIYPVKKEGADNSGAVQTFKVVGTIRGMQKNKMQILAGRPVMVELGDAATVQVKAGDATFCAPGDRVKLKGLRHPSQPNFIQLQTVTIEGNKPLGQQQVNPRRRSRTNRTDRSKTTQDDSTTKPQDADSK